jgi:ABC-type polysaccharide/polyol phosphate transport system ATPase subunit
MRSELAISADSLTKTFRIFGHPGDRIKQALTFGRMRFHREFTALREVSFDVKKGETVGIIGRNGSGKSTLLQLVCGILKPTSGKVEANGRISALLELGSGFNPEFTGRENVYFQGAVLGIQKAEMALRFDDIAAFADIGDFMDQPVRTYSSGMFVRLAFSVAIHVDPKILIVDEALAVGDSSFQSKCFQRIKAFQKNGGSILLVTHSLEQVGHFCDRVFLLDCGNLVADGSASETLTRYTNGITRKSSDELLKSLPSFDERPFTQVFAIDSQEIVGADRDRVLLHQGFCDGLAVQALL